MRRCGRFVWHCCTVVFIVQCLQSAPPPTTPLHADLTRLTCSIVTLPSIQREVTVYFKCVWTFSVAYMVCTAHRLQCKTPHFPKHKFPVHAMFTECSNAPEINCTCGTAGPYNFITMVSSILEGGGAPPSPPQFQFIFVLVKLMWAQQLLFVAGRGVK